MELMLLMLLFSTMAGLVNGGARFTPTSEQITAANVSHNAFHTEKKYYSAIAASSTYSTNESQSFGAGTKIGSKPPSCGNKCQGCRPCTPVKVTIPAAKGASKVISATDKRLEKQSSELDDLPYYNQAWRCRCKGNDYNP